MNKITNMQDKILGPALAVDTVVFSIAEDKLMTLLIKIGSGPYTGKWAIPGGLVGLGETTDQAATRALLKKTNIKSGHLEQLYTFSKLGRDSRGQIVSVAYLLLVNDSNKLKIKAQDFYVDIKWFSVNDLPDMAFDHKEILEFAHKRLKDKINYSTIAYSLLKTQFTLTSLQKTYEIILGEKIDKRNFRKQMLTRNIISKADSFARGKQRPAQLYKFINKKITFF